jgi:hypothetical protein
MRKALILLLALVSLCSCGKKPDYIVRDYSGNYTIIGYSQEEIIELDVGFYPVDLIRSGGGYSDHIPGAVIVYENFGQKRYKLKTYGSSDLTFGFSPYPTDAE